MGIYSALTVGRTALNTSQVALEVVGNNIANSATPNYSRQNVNLAPNPSIGQLFKIGTGVQITGIRRNYDAMVESQLRHALADSANQSIQKQTLDRIEGLLNETSDYDLSTALTSFFNGFSELANDPTSDGVRTIVTERARALVNEIVDMRGSLNTLRLELNSLVETAVDEINRLSEEVANLNIQVVSAEGGVVGSAPSLRDERDAAMRELADYIDIRVVEQESGLVNVIIGNQVLVDGRHARELTIDLVEDRGATVGEVRFADNDELVALTGGALSGYVTGRDEWIAQQVDMLDRFAQTLALEVNRIHAEGTGTSLPQSVRSEQFVLDETAELTSDEAGLYNDPENGSFLLHVTNKTSGLTDTMTIDVDLDGAGGDDSLADVVNRINTLAAAQVPPVQVTASVDATGHLVIAGATPEMRVSFSDDTSGLLACMGVNALFSGYDAWTIGLSDTISENTSLLAAGMNGAVGDNANAIRMANLADTEFDVLGGASLVEYHHKAVTRLAVNTASVGAAANAADSFVSTMSDQREAISGVNLDEEAVSLIRYQKMYAAAARFMSVMSELMDTLMNL